MTTETESGFMVGDRVYPVPGLETFTIADHMTFYEYAGFSTEDLDEDNLTNPGVMAAFVHIAVRRGNPQLKDGKVKAIVLATNFEEALSRFENEDEDEEEMRPPASTPESSSTSEPEPSSERSSNGSSETSGTDSTTTSDEPDATPAAIGTSESATSPTSDPATPGT